MIWREATREEVYRYYTERFPCYIDDLPDHITATGPKEYGLSFFQRHPVKRDDRPPVDFIRRDTWDTDSSGSQLTPQFTGFNDGERPLLDFITVPGPNDPLRETGSGLVDPALREEPGPLPYAVYYSLAHHDRSHVVVVDIDAKDIAYDRACQHTDQSDTERKETLQQAGILSGDPAGYPYEFRDVRRALEYGFTVQDILQDSFNASNTQVVYSGQGCHVYLLDDDRSHHYDTRSRNVIATLLEERYDIPIDRQVTIGDGRLIRLPYSLHAEVCRVVQPIESPSFDFKHEAVPRHIDPEMIEHD